MVHPNENFISSQEGYSSSGIMPKKKVEWSSTLSSVESLAPEDRSPTWDCETDHLLSYFLGGDGNHSNGGITASPLTMQFANVNVNTKTTGRLTATRQETTSSSMSSASRPRPSNGILHTSHPLAAMPNLGNARATTTIHYHHGLHHGHDLFDDDPVPPPTPAIQYYHQSKPKAKSTSNINSNSDSRSSAGASIGPMLMPSNHSLMQLKASFGAAAAAADTSNTSSITAAMEGLSPISPAAMISNAEPMMLPPPDHNYIIRTPQQHHHQQQQQQHSVKTATQTHMEWLQHINAMAKKALLPQPQRHAHPNPQQQQQQQPQQQHHIMPPQLQPQPPPNMPAPTINSFFPMYYHTQAALTQIQQQQLQKEDPQETEEKRARRLERNRESARKSRRRKKERLTALEGQVDKLHNQIDAERRNQLNLMNAVWADYSRQRVLQSSTESDSAPTGSSQGAALATALQDAGLNCPIQRAVVDFQYSALEKMVLPKYQRFALWLSLHSDQYFLAGKEQHMRRGDGKQLLRVNSGKLSSKQVGDELTNGRKLEDGTIEPPEIGGGSTAQAFDGLRMWPLLCFDLSISVDQEERMLLALKSVQKLEHLQRDRTQIAAADRMTSTLKEAVLYQSHNAAARSEKTYLDILTPHQTMLYQKWLSSNRERCQQATSRRKPSSDANSSTGSSTSTETLCLMELCRKLEEVLNISKGHMTTAGANPNSVE